jgi:hypothetical protein
MKHLLALQLIAAFILELQCNGACIAQVLNSTSEVSSSSAEPPCHQHPQRTDLPQRRHETFTPCGQQPIIRTKGSADANYMVDLGMTPPFVPLGIKLRQSFGPEFTGNNPAGVGDPALTIRVLRI